MAGDSRQGRNGRTSCTKSEKARPPVRRAVWGPGADAKLAFRRRPIPTGKSGSGRLLSLNERNPPTPPPCTATARRPRGLNLPRLPRRCMSPLRRGCSTLNTWSSVSRARVTSAISRVAIWSPRCSIMLAGVEPEPLPPRRFRLEQLPAARGSGATGAASCRPCCHERRRGQRRRRVACLHDKPAVDRAEAVRRVQR